MLNPHDNIQEYADSYLHGLLSDSESQAVLSHCEHCEQCRAELARAQKRFAAFQAVPREAVASDLVSRAFARVDHEERQLKKQQHLSNFEKTFWPLMTAAALVLAMFHINWSTSEPTSYDLVVYGQNQLFANASGSLRVMLLDREDGQPVSNTQVAIDLSDTSRQQTIRLASFITDEHGTGMPKFHLPDWPNGDYELKITAESGRVPEVIARTIRLKRDWKIMLSTDKPVYQPGQTIRVRSLALRLPNRKPTAGQTVTYRVIDPKGNVIAKQVGVTSKFGISSFDCPLASELIQGPYQVESQIGESVSTVTVDVKKYVLPKLKVSASLDEPFYQLGQTISGTVEASYFFGKPVAQGTVTLEVTGNTPEQQSLIAPISLTLDDTGKGQFQFPVPAPLVGTEWNDGDAEILLTLTARDTAGQQQQTFLSCLITKQPIRIELIPESPQLVTGVPNRIYIFTSYADGRPAAARLAISGQSEELTASPFGVASFEFTPEAQTNEPQSFVISATDSSGVTVNREFQLSMSSPLSDFLIRTDQAVYNGGETLRLQAFGNESGPVLLDVIKDQQTFLTDSIAMQNGRGEIAIDLTPELHGTLQICAYRFTPSGHAVKKLQTVFVRRASELTIQANLDKPSYRPGESAQLKLKVTHQDGQPAPCALSLSLVDQAVFSVVEKRVGLQRTFFDLEQKLLQPIYQLYPWSPSLSAGKATDAHRELERALFHWSQNAGKKDHGAWLEELIDLYADKNRSLLEVLERPDVDELAESSWLPEGALALLRGEHSTHSLNARSFPAKQFENARWKQRNKDFTYKVWGLLGALAFLGLLFSIGNRLENGCLGIILIVVSILILMGLMLPAVNQVREAARETSAMNDLRSLGLAIEDQKLQQRFSGLAHGENGQVSPRVRQWFPETLLWRPELITDDRGELTVDVNLADSITNWRVSASAVSANGQLGANDSSLTVFQPFFVDVELPVALTRGDEISLPVVIYNYLPQSQSVEISLAANDWCECLEANMQTIELGANETRSTYFRIRPHKIGKQTLRITALGDEQLTDAIQREIEVLPEGQPVTQTTNGSFQGTLEHTITVPADAVADSAKTIVKIYPSRFSQVIEGLETIFRRPNGCFEQTSSTTYPSVLALAYLRKTQQSIPEVEVKAQQYIHLGYQRLLTFEIDGGGFEWFGHPPAHPLLTAYGLMEFKDMSQVHAVDPELIARTQTWLLSQQQEDGSWKSSQTRSPRNAVKSHGSLAATAYIAWALFDSQSPSEEMAKTRESLLMHTPESIDSPYLLALVANALQAMGADFDALPYVDRLLSLKYVSDAQVPSERRLAWWISKRSNQTVFYGRGLSADIEVTALATLALLNAQREPETVAGALRWLVEQKDKNGVWRTTQATIMALKALLRGTGQALESPHARELEIEFNGNVVQVLHVSAGQGDVMQQVVLPDLALGSDNVLKIRDKRNSSSGFQIVTQYYVADSPDQKENSPLEIDLQYDRSELSVRDQVTVNAMIQNHQDDLAPMVMVTLPIPPGFAMEVDDLETLVQQGTIAKYDLTPRSAVLYLRALAPQESIHFVYHLEAKMPLKVQVAPARTYLYYQPELEGWSDPSELTVLAN